MCKHSTPPNTKPCVRNKWRTCVKAKCTWQNKRRKDPQLVRHENLLTNHGIRLEDFEAWFASQGSRCRICKTDKPSGRGFCVDHCHDSMRLRGILCFHCNALLGHAKDNPDTLRSAALYLERTATSKRKVTITK